MGKRKKKVNKKKFLKRIFLLLLIIIFAIVIIKNLNKKVDKVSSIKVIVNEEDLSNSLQNEAYIDKSNILYLSLADIREIFDKNIFYEKETGKIITTSHTKVAAIDVDSNIVELNSANLILSAGMLVYNKENEDFYLPISEMTNIYNIETSQTENSAVISSLYDELITVKTSKKESLKESPSGFSKTTGKIKEDTELIFINDTDKNGWTKVLTYERKFWVY